MKYSEFDGKKISRLGFGTMRLPLNGDGKIDEEAGQEMIDYALANGINYIDTAYTYHSGRAESFLGRALSKYPRDSYCLADKLPLWNCEGDEKKVSAIFEKQLQKCGTDHFDFYLLHNLNDETWSIAKSVNALKQVKQFKKDGRITHLGASFHSSLDLYREILEECGDALEFIQLQINYFDWEYENASELYQIAREYNKPIIVMEPLRGGMLAAPISRDACSTLDSAGTGASYASYGLRFADELEGVFCTLSGMSSLEQLKQNIEIFSGPAMNDAEKEALSEAAEKLKSDILIPCTGCNYCFECPMLIRIADIFKLYNDAAATGFHALWDSPVERYMKMSPNADDCAQCGMCESRCPQGIKIIDKLKEVDAKFTALAAAGEN